MPEERLQKILSRAGICSRRRAEELIEAGLVTVNGRTAVLGDKADPAEDAIKVDGKRVPNAVPNRYLLLHKPEGHMCTVSDPEGRPTVLDLIPARLRRALVPVGRLDYNTEGLLLLTTDGEFAQRVAHPRYGCKKTYEVKVKGMPEDSEVARLREGMWIDGKRTEPADVSFLRRTKARGQANNTWWRVTLGEGRTRQIREMFFRVGHPVQRLRRIAIGALEDRQLEKGAWRELTEAEVTALMTGEGGLKGSRAKKSAPGGRPAEGATRYRSGERRKREAATAAGEARQKKRRTPRVDAKKGASGDRAAGTSRPRRPPSSRRGGASSADAQPTGRRGPSRPRKGAGPSGRKGSKKR